MNYKKCSRRAYYKYQEEAAEDIVDYVKNDCIKYASNLEDGSYVSTDAQWNHPTNGSSEMTSFYDHKQIKFIGFECTSKSKRIFKGNYEGNSNNMESAGIERGLTNLKPIIKNKKLTISHDHDGQTSGIIKRRVDLNLEETLDPGHAAKEIKRKANTHFDKLSREIKNKNDPERSTLKKCFELFEVLIGKIIWWLN